MTDRNVVILYMSCLPDVIRRTRSLIGGAYTWVLHFLSSLYRPDNDPDKDQNIVVKAKYIYTW
jgi:hypothetical protein